MSQNPTNASVCYASSLQYTYWLGLPSTVAHSVFQTGQVFTVQKEGLFAMNMQVSLHEGLVKSVEKRVSFLGEQQELYS